MGYQINNYIVNVSGPGYKDKTGVYSEGSCTYSTKYIATAYSGEKRPYVVSVDSVESEDCPDSYLTNCQSAYSNSGAITSCNIVVPKRSTPTCKLKVTTCGTNSTPGWLSTTGACCQSENSEACCLANANPNSNHYVQGQIWLSDTNTCCRSRNQSEACCNALCTAEYKRYQNGECQVGGWHKGEIVYDLYNGQTCEHLENPDNPLNN